MKTPLIYPILVLFSLIFIQCADSSNKANASDEKVTAEVEKVEDSPKVTVQDTISLKNFNTWTADWKSSGVSFTNTTLLEYFTMDLVDLSEVLNDPQAAEARFYLGLDKSKTPNEPHLILVAVDSNGKNLLDYSAGYYAYDMTRPCPPACPNGF